MSLTNQCDGIATHITIGGFECVSQFRQRIGQKTCLTLLLFHLYVSLRAIKDFDASNTLLEYGSCAITTMMLNPDSPAACNLAVFKVISQKLKSAICIHLFCLELPCDLTSVSLLFLSVRAALTLGGVSAAEFRLSAHRSTSVVCPYSRLNEK